MHLETFLEKNNIDYSEIIGGVKVHDDLCLAFTKNLILPDKIIADGDFELIHTDITELSKTLIVHGNFYCIGPKIIKYPGRMIITGRFDLEEI